MERETTPKRTEWHHFAIAPKTSLEYFNDFAGQDFPDLPSSGGEDDYVLRPEQQAAVDQAVAAFEAGKAEVLWNAKPRFGKTLTTYDLMRTLDVRRVLIVTNRPAIANSWFDDFTRFIGHQTTYRFVSESPSLAEPFAHDSRAVACLLAQPSGRGPAHRGVPLAAGPQGVAVLRRLATTSSSTSPSSTGTCW